MKKALHPDPEPSFLPRSTILQSRYRVVKRLGSGGMGAVYEAFDQRLNISVALKETFSTDRRLRRQFAREARLLARLNHPALPRVSDYFTESDRAFIVMQFIPGPDLADVLMRRGGPFPRHEVIAWADELLDALAYLHSPERQIIHRDIKPHNLKLTHAGHIALLDFGLAKSERTESSLNSHSSIFGYTWRYSPPEQIQDEGTTPKSDIYALGATLYHLFTGVKPPDALTRATAIAEGKPDPLLPAQEVYSEVGSDIAPILHRAMALNAEDRYSSAAEFREALARIDLRDIVAEQITPPSCSQSANTVNVRMTVAERPRRIVLENVFDNNSIFTPENEGWLLSEPSHAPPLAVAIFVIMLLCFIAVRYDLPNWFGGRSTPDEARKETVLTASDKLFDQSKPYRLDLRTTKKASAPGTTQLIRRNEKSKRTNRR